MSDGEHAYNAYLESSGGKSLVSGVSLPEFAQLPEKIRAAWEHVADTLKRRFTAIATVDVNGNICYE